MGKKSELINKAKSYLGANYKHFCDEFGGGCWAWCAAFVSTVARESGNADCIPRSTSCNAQISSFKRQGAWLGVTADIRVGDILYYDWDHINEPLPADHVGIVTAVNGDSVTVLEGNKGDADNNKTVVGYRTISRTYKYIFGIARPKYAGEDIKPVDKYISVEIRQLQKGAVGKDVEAMQAILIAKGYSCGTYGSDGDFGDATESAVTNFQKEHKLEADGICGVKTWKELIER